MAWVYLFIAGLFEVVWAIGLKYSQGFSRLVPTVITFIGLVISLLLLAQSLKTLPVGTAYAVWTGIGAVGTVIAGIFLFNEPSDLPRMVCILLIVVGIVGLRLVAPAH